MKEKTIRMFLAQFNALNFTTQFGAAVAGVQSGKTFAGAHWAGKKIQEFPKGSGLIVSPTHNILRAATLKKFFDVFPELRAGYKEQKGEIHLPTGGIVYVRSADNPLGIEGITANWIWLDEGGMTSVLTWTVLRSRVSMTRGQILITTTPYNMGWLYTDFFIPWRDKRDSSLSFFTWRSIDNPYFSEEFYEAEKRRLRPEEFSRRYMGEFRKMTGLVYDLPDELICGLLDWGVKTEARIIGVDWGFRNPAAIIVCYLRDNAWHIVDEWKQSERTTAEIIQVIKNKLSEHKATAIFPDPAEPDRIEECRRAGLPVMETNKDIKGGVSHIQQLIREKRFFIANNNKETLEEINMYHYPESQDNKPEKDEPEKFNDHLCFSGETLIRTKRGILPIYEVKGGDFIWSPLGWTRVIKQMKTGKRKTYLFGGVKITSNHPIATQRGFVPLDTIRYDDKIMIWSQKQLFTMELNSDGILIAKEGLKGFILPLLRRNVSAIKQNVFTGIYGKSSLVKYPKAFISIIKMAIRLIIILVILKFYLLKNILGKILNFIKNRADELSRLQELRLSNGTNLKLGAGFIFGLVKNLGKEKSIIQKNVKYAEANIKPLFLKGLNTAKKEKAKIIAELKQGGLEDVYSLATENGMFFAGEIAVSNCDAIRYAIYSYAPSKQAVYQQSQPIQPYYGDRELSF